MNSQYQEMIHLSRYSRWIEEEGKRESWEQTVKRYFDFFQSEMKRKHNFDMPRRDELEKAVLNMEIMPSMRALWLAGPAAARCNIGLYNCAALAVDSPRAFDEGLAILLAGTGLGFSVEEQFISQLPEVAEHFEDSSTIILVRDSKSGWARAFRELISLLYVGQVPKWDLTQIRPAGARLITSGGRASGPAPLNDLFEFTVRLFKKAAGRKLYSIEAHDLMCKAGEIVTVGGIRRSAELSLSNLEDNRMRYAKSGDWYYTEGHRALANNSVAYTEKPDLGSFMKEWRSLYKSRSGERGFFNRVAARKQAEKSGRRKSDVDFLCNPCGEILLKPSPGQKCNLSEVIIRETDTEESVMRKLELATLLGTYQSCFTDFKYLRKGWKKNADEERLLGVSLTGIMDNWKLMNNKEFLQRLRERAVEVNKEEAEKIGINQSAAITTLKPSGTVSQLCNTASGIHTRWAAYYIRTVRGDKKDPLTQLMIDQGIPNEPCIMKPSDTVVFSFPQKAPEGAILRKDFTAIDSLEAWKLFQENYVEHNVSCTINVRENEWLAVADWVWNNFDSICGLSFLPYSDSDHVYKQAPYQEITKEEYEDWMKKMPEKIDWTKLPEYEKDDQTQGAQTLACTGDVCEMVSLG